MRENPTRLVDVAARAGVSTATVARVIHGNAAVRPTTRAAVQAALEETGYRLNALAQGLKTRRTRTIGHLLQNVFPNPFNVEVALGLEAAAKRAGYRVLLYNARDEELERRAVDIVPVLAVEALLRVDHEQDRLVTADQAHRGTLESGSGRLQAAAPA